MFRRTLIFAAVLGTMTLAGGAVFAGHGHYYHHHQHAYPGYYRPIVVAPRPVVVTRPLVVPQVYPYATSGYGYGCNTGLGYGYSPYQTYGYGSPYGASFGYSSPNFGLYISR